MVIKRDFVLLWHFSSVDLKALVHYESRVACVLHISTFFFFFFPVVLKYIICVCVLYILFLRGSLPHRYLIASNHVPGPSQYIPFPFGVTDVFIRDTFSKGFIGVLPRQWIYRG